jgi:hypothetical protein
LSLMSEKGYQKFKTFIHVIWYFNSMSRLSSG